MAEYISREAVVRMAYGYCHTIDGRCCGPDDVVELYEELKAIPAADVVEWETYRELLKAARKMHLWIFLNTVDESQAYDECGLTDEMNALLGYGVRGEHDFCSRGERKDGTDE